MLLDIRPDVCEILWRLKYLVHGPELHAGPSHSAHVASSSAAAQPGHSAGSSVAQSSGLLHSNLLPVCDISLVSTPAIFSE